MKKLLLVLIPFVLYAAGGDTLQYSNDVNNLADGDAFYSDVYWHPMKDSISSIINGRLGNINLADDANISFSKMDTTSEFKSNTIDVDTADIDSLQVRTINATGQITGSTLHEADSLKITGTAEFNFVTFDGESKINKFEENTVVACTLKTSDVTVQQVGSMDVTRINKVVHVIINGALDGTSNSTTLYLYADWSSLFGTTWFTTTCPVENNGAVVLGIATYSSSAPSYISFTLYDGSAFTSSGSKGFGNSSFSVLLR